MKGFPEGFLFGTATSAHQVEGGNTNSDWWEWEHSPGTPCVEPSGDACDFYHRYREDVALMAGLGFNAFRFSLEWARIEPEENEFSNAALDHYRAVLAACREHRIAPLVTFHHYTLPRWLQKRGGFLLDQFPRFFERYCDRATAALGDLIAYACTINEPEGLGGPHVEWGKGLPQETDNSTQLGQENYPAALGRTIRRAWQTTGGTPILVTENGIATDDDAKRVRYIGNALREVLACLEDGIDVRGYLHWTLLDNFEWSLGYRPRFGLVSVDSVTFARTPKPSAYWLGAVAQTRSLPTMQERGSLTRSSQNG